MVVMSKGSIWTIFIFFLLCIEIVLVISSPFSLNSLTILAFRLQLLSCRLNPIKFESFKLSFSHTYQKNVQGMFASRLLLQPIAYRFLRKRWISLPLFVIVLSLILALFSNQILLRLNKQHNGIFVYFLYIFEIYATYNYHKLPESARIFFRSCLHLKTHRCSVHLHHYFLFYIINQAPCSPFDFLR